MATGKSKIVLDVKPRPEIIVMLISELEAWDLGSVSKASGVHIRTLQYWLEGRTRVPRLDSVEKVAPVIGFTLTLKPVLSKKYKSKLKPAKAKVRQKVRA